MPQIASNSSHFVSKRRFNPDEEAMMEDGFEMVSSNVYDPADVKVDIATRNNDCRKASSVSSIPQCGPSIADVRPKKWGRFLSMLSSEKG